MVIRLKRCPKCQKNVERDAEFCPSCGGKFAFRASKFEADPDALPPPPPRVAPAPHDVTMALSASLCVSGTGQMYNGQTGKGIVLLLLTTVPLVLALLWREWCWPLLAAAALVWLFSMMDAAVIAGRVLNHERIRPWQWF